MSSVQCIVKSGQIHAMESGVKFNVNGMLYSLKVRIVFYCIVI